MKIGLCPSPKKEDALAYTQGIGDYLKRYGADVYVDEEVSSLYPPIARAPHIDIFMTLGGDGTLLTYKNKYLDHDSSAFVGVNLGSLGFMADVRIEDYEPYLLDLLEGNYEIEERIMLQCTTPEGVIYHALNDLVFYRGSISSMIRLKVEIVPEYFNTFHSDGLIIATPTGSTAYSLSAGGPILHPTVKALVITPIAAHTLTSRPFVTPLESLINVEYLSDNGPIQATVDGLHSFPLSNHESVPISLSPKTCKLVVFTKKHNFYATLRTKLFTKAY